MRVGMGLSRDQEIDYAAARGIEIPITKASPYSIDVNLWGRSCETGVLEDPWVAPPADAYEWTVEPSAAPDAGRDRRSRSRAASRSPSTASGSGRSSSIERLHALGGAHGVGRIDHVEDRLVGIKSREIYEAPAAAILHAAHRALEGLTLSKDTLRFNRLVADELAQLTYDGLWFSALHRDLRGYVASSQRVVSGDARIRLDHGSAVVVGRRSPLSLYDKSLATYDEGDAFDHAAAVGFIEIFGLPLRVEAARHGRSATHHGAAWTWTDPLLDSLPTTVEEAAGAAAGWRQALTYRPRRGISRRRRAGRAGVHRPSAGCLAAQARVAGLDHLVDQPQPLVERQERRLHRVEGQPLHLAEADPERGVERGELARQGHVAHQPVVGVDRDPEAQPAEQVDRVLRDRRGKTGVDVRGRTQLERDPPVTDVGRQPPQPGAAVRLDLDVVDDPDAVAEPLGAEVERLADRRQPVAFAGVEGEVEACMDEPLERVREAARRIAGLGAGDVEADDALVAVAERQLGGLERAVRLAHRRHELPDDDRTTARGRPAIPCRNPSVSASTTASRLNPPAVDSSGA